MSHPRSQTPAAYRWRLEDIYPTNDAWEQEFTQAQALTQQLSALSGTLADSADSLFAALDLQSRLSLTLERLYVYARMRRDEDNGNALYQGMADRAMQLSVSVQAATAGFQPEILSIDPATLRAWASEPRFDRFRFELEDLDRQREHVLSPAEERILALAGDPLTGPNNIFTMLNNVDLDFGTIENEAGQQVPLTHGSYSTFLQSPDRRVRQDAYRGLYKAYQGMKNTIAAAYAASVKSDLFSARARGYEGCLEAALFVSNVPTQVYTQLLEAVHEGLPALHKYLELRKKLLGLSQLEMYDLYTPLIPDQSQAMTYEEAKVLVREALAPLGENYQALLDRAFTEGWIDVYENDGKTSGAYSWGVYGVHPYVLLNHQDTLESAFTLAHELGHAMHSYHSDAANPYELAQYRIMVAEVASTVNESLLMRYLLDRETQPGRRAWLLNKFLEQVRTTCFRQTLFAEFELKAHRMAEQGEPLTVESLSKVYKELNETYYQGVNVDEDAAIEWMRIPHFYRAFYVYQYATGICSALALSSDVLDRGGLTRYLRFLSSGGSDYPIRELQDAGVDLTCKDPIRSAMALFAQRVDELASLV